MSIFRLTEEELFEVKRSLPDIDRTGREILMITPEVVAIKFPSDPSIALACVCFHDTYFVLEEIRFALAEAAAHKVWFARHSQSADPRSLNFYVRFYCDDAALRLYAAAEHLAEAIIGMLKVDRDLLPGDPGNSLATRVGQYMTHNMKHLKVAEYIEQLVASESYIWTIDYRNLWVHEQAPLIEGCQSRYNKRKRWQKEQRDSGPAARVLYLMRNGDRAQYTVEQLHHMVVRAFECFASTFANVHAAYHGILKTGGITMMDTGVEFNFP